MNEIIVTDSILFFSNSGIDILQIITTYKNSSHLQDCYLLKHSIYLEMVT